MIHLASTYLIVRDMEKSIEFYSKLLEMEPTARAFNRFAQFWFEEKCIALYYDGFDKLQIERNENLKQHYNNEYLEYIKQRKILYGNNVVLNFWIEDLNKEYERVCNLYIGPVSKIMYVNIACPYYFFMINDPDGNVIEITGEYTDI